MKAFTKIQYGGPEVLKLEEVDKPQAKADEILVKVMANSANPADWHILRGDPFFARFVFGLFKPKDRILGADFAGIVEAIGSNVKSFNVGDRVFGSRLQGGAFAAYVCVSPDHCAAIPDGTDFATMAALPIAGLTALQALTTQRQLKKGESVFINGASGGVGHLCVQLANAYGAHVTGVCSARNVEFVKGLGAKRVIAYDQEDIHKHQTKYDLIIDTHGNLTYDDFKRMGHRSVAVGFTSMGHMIRLSARSAIGKHKPKQFTANANTKDLTTLAELINRGDLRVHIDKTFPYHEIPEAIRYIEKLRTKGKVVMVWDGV